MGSVLPQEGNTTIFSYLYRCLYFFSIIVNAFKQEKKLKTFGMPLYLGSGSHEFKSEKYRFVVTDHFGMDLWKIFIENNEVFPISTVFKIAVQIVSKMFQIPNEFLTLIFLVGCSRIYSWSRLRTRRYKGCQYSDGENQRNEK